MKKTFFPSSQKKIKYPAAGLLLVLSILLISCSAKSAGEMYDVRVVPAEYSSSMKNQGFRDEILSEDSSVNEAERQSAPLENLSAGIERKLVKKADLRIEADKSFVNSDGTLSGVNQKVDELMKKYGAYSESTQSDENSSNFIIRVPKIHYESLIEGTSVLGKLRSRSETAEDVTLRYYDLEGRLNTKKTLLETFHGYLSRAKDIDDIMKVETRIAELQNEIDWLGNQLTNLANLVDYATVVLDVYSYRQTKAYTLAERVKQLFSSFGDFASDALVVILGIIFYGGPIVIICLIAFWLFFGRIGILKKAFRFALRSNGKKSKKQKEKPAASENGDAQI